MCSGLCEIKDTGDSMLGSSGQSENMGYSLHIILKNRINKPEKKVPTHCLTGYNIQLEALRV